MTTTSPSNAHGELSAVPDEEQRQDCRCRSRTEIAAGDHRDPPDGVEQSAQHQRPEEVPEGEDDDEDRDESRRDACRTC